MSITAECLPSILNTVTHRESRKNPEWLLHPKVFKQFSTTRFSCKIFICFLSMSSATSIYSLASRSIQSGDRCNDIKLKHRSSISPHQYDFRSAPKNKTGMRSSPDSDCTSLEYPTIMVPRTFNPFCYGTSAAATWKDILISQKSIVHRLMVENSLTLAAWLVSRKPFRVKEF